MLIVTHPLPQVVPTSSKYAVWLLMESPSSSHFHAVLDLCRRTPSRKSSQLNQGFRVADGDQHIATFNPCFATGIENNLAIAPPNTNDHDVEFRANNRFTEFTTNE